MTPELGLAESQGNSSGVCVEQCSLHDDEDVAALRAELQKVIAEADCDAGECDESEMEVQPALPRASSRGRRVLLIDNDVVVPAATRYADRILGYAQLSEGGAYKTVVPAIAVNAAVREVFRKVNEFPRHLRSEDLGVDEEFFTGPGKRLPVGHGTNSLAYLADQVPQAQFVVSDDEPVPTYDCGLSDPGNQTAWDELEAYKQQVEQSLSAIVREYEIDLIHFSWGISDSVVRRAFSDCPHPASDAVSIRIQHMWRDLFTALTSARGQDAVVLFQAGESVTEHQEVLNPLDCLDIPGRVRVFWVGHFGYEVGPAGSADYSLLPVNGKDAARCNDVMIVMGQYGLSSWRDIGFVGYRAYSMGVTQDGFPASSSFANPVAAAHFLYLRDLYPQSSSLEVLNTIKNAGEPRILDPMLHAQLPVCLERARAAADK